MKRRLLLVRIASLLRWSSAGAIGWLGASAPFAAQANCDIQAPVTGQAVTCDDLSPNPENVPVAAAIGSSNVTVNVLSGAAIGVNNATAVSLQGLSQLNNAGDISVTGTASGVSLVGGGVVNDGSIVAMGGPGIVFGGTASGTVVNRGTIQGAPISIGFGAGDDRFEMLGGLVAGVVTMGDGNDVLVVNDGSLSVVDQGNGADRADVGGSAVVTSSIQQGIGTDTFTMTGGQIAALAQGDGIDTFLMSGGRISGVFEGGDRATMTGGRIGRVDMNIDNNVFDMSGGTIDGNLVAGFGNDTVVLSNGYIGGNISLSGGSDQVSITGGTVRGSLLMSFGTDTFTWDGGGILYGTVDLGPDNDTAVLRNLHGGNLGAIPTFRGGGATDHLTFDNVLTNGVGRFLDWESVAVTHSTQLTFDGNFFLGDAVSGTGAMSIDATSTLYGGGGVGGGIVPIGPGQLVNVSNAGRIDLTNGGSGPIDTFTVAGNYVGNSAALFLESQLGDDASPSDKLVISGGAASGTTGISVINAGGAGAATLLDGILVVQGVNGGSTADGAFALYAPVAAGAFEYLLFKGGVNSDTGNNWYLRSTLVSPLPAPEPAPAPSSLTPPEAVAPTPPEPAVPPPPPLPPAPSFDENAPPPPPEQPEPLAPPPPQAPPPAPGATTPPSLPPVPAEPAGAPAPGASPPTPGATPASGDVIPLYRIETPTYAVVPPVVHELVMATLGTFHERQGEQYLMQGSGGVPAAWGRVIGQNTEVSWAGTVNPSFDGSLWGVQVGLDLFARESGSGHRDRFGLFLGQAQVDGDARGFALGWNDLTVGEADLDDTHLGLYWTHVTPSGAYIDAVVLGNRFDGDASSDRGIGIDIDGDAVSLSLEGGAPLRWSADSRWSLEPQLQVVWQHVSIDDRQDAFARIAFESDGAVVGRFSLRLFGDYETANGMIQPYLKANIWYGTGAEDRIAFNADVISTRQRYNAFEFGGGVVARLNRYVSVYAVADYTIGLGDEGGDREIIEGNLGVRVAW